MKKILSLFLSLVMVISIISILDFSAFAMIYSGSCGVNTKWSFNKSNSILTISGTGNMTNYDDYYDVPWYSNDLTEQIKKVVISKGVTGVGDYAFFNCINLIEVSMTDEVKYIGGSAFAQCSNLKEITLPNSLTTINPFCFFLCYQLNNIIIPNNVTKIEFGAFSSSGVSNITLSKKLKYIEDEAFSNTNISNIVFNDGLETIGKDCFMFCEELQSVTIPKTVKYIGDGAFSYCGKLSKVDIKYGVNKIGDEAFGSCSNLNYIVIPSSVTNIGKLAFGTIWENLETGKRFLDENFIIYGHKGNKSETYAKTNGVKFIDGHKGSTSLIKATTSKNGKKVVNCTICNKTITTILYYPKTVTLSSTSYTYDGKAKKPTVTIKDSNNKTIPASNYSLSYSNNINAGTATVKVTFKGNYSGVITKKYTIKKIASSSCKVSLSATSYTYDGKVKQPSVTVKDSKGNKIASSNYTVTYASGRKNVGTYKVTVKFKGNYSGTVTKSFTIKLKSTSISSISTPKSAQIKLKWKKASNIDGYEIQVSKSSKFTSNTKKYTVKKSATSSTLKFVKKTKSYVRMRTYKTINGKKYYSSWSKTKSIKTK